MLDGANTFLLIEIGSASSRKTKNGVKKKKEIGAAELTAPANSAQSPTMASRLKMELPTMAPSPTSFSWTKMPGGGREHRM